MPLLVLPAMVGVLVDETGMTETFAGWSASASFLGGALTAVLMAFRMHRLDLRKTATMALVVAVLGGIASALTPGLMLIRCLSGPRLAALMVGDGNCPAVFLPATVLFLVALAGFFVSDHQRLYKGMAV